jgi:hypothetical protein
MEARFSKTLPKIEPPTIEALLRNQVQIRDGFKYLHFRQPLRNRRSPASLMPHSYPQGEMLPFNHKVLVDWISPNPKFIADVIEQAAYYYLANPRKKALNQKVVNNNEVQFKTRLIAWFEYSLRSNQKVEVFPILHPREPILHLSIKKSRASVLGKHLPAWQNSIFIAVFPATENARFASQPLS